MKILILGAAGMLGHQVWLKSNEAFKASLNAFKVGCTLRKSKNHYDKFNIFNQDHVYDNIDLSDFKNAENVLESFKPDWIINCVGLTLRKREVLDIEKCYEINSMLPHKLALWALKHNSRLIHISTDCVFGGKRGSYTELDYPSANDVYGKSKFLGEVGYQNSLTLRLSIVGRELESKTELIEWLISQKNKTVKGFSNAIYSGLTTNHVAKQIIYIIQQHSELYGTYHIASEPISKFELLKKVNKIYNLNVKIEPSQDVKSDKSLNCERYSSVTGFIKPKWDDMIEEMKQEELLIYEK